MISVLPCLPLSLSVHQGTVIVGNEIHGLKVKHLHVGGVLGAGEVQNGIRGCIQVSLDGRMDEEINRLTD